MIALRGHWVDRLSKFSDKGHNASRFTTTKNPLTFSIHSMQRFTPFSVLALKIEGQGVIVQRNPHFDNKRESKSSSSTNLIVRTQLHPTKLLSVEFEL